MYAVSAINAVVASNWCAAVIVAVTVSGLGPPRPHENAPVEPRTVPANNVVVGMEPVEVPVSQSLQLQLLTR